MSTSDETDPQPTETGTVWDAVVEVDRAWYGLKGMLAEQPCPIGVEPATVRIDGHTALVGRTSENRNIFPEIPLDDDPGVSRRHAQFVREGDGLMVVDLSSTNGTYVLRGDDKPHEHLPSLVGGVPCRLLPGDRVYVGAWSRITVRPSDGA